MTCPAFLTGVEPFPSLDDWRADAALRVRQHLKFRELDDPDCHAVLTSIDRQDLRGWIKTLTCPETLAFVVDDPKQWTWKRLRVALASRPASEHRRPEVRARVGEEFEVILRHQGQGTRGPSSADARFLAPHDPRFASYEERLTRAFDVVERVAPGFAAEIVALVDGIALVDDKASFRGASGLGHHGLVFFSPDDTWTVGVFVEEIVHEATHTLLDTLSIGEPFLSGADALTARWEAPFRPDKRPLLGNFHALVVVSRLIHLFQHFRRSEVAVELDWNARARDYARRAQRSLDALVAYPGLSPLAREILEALVRPTLMEWA